MAWSKFDERPTGTILVREESEPIRGTYTYVHPMSAGSHVIRRHDGGIVIVDESFFWRPIKEGLRRIFENEK